MDHCIRDMRDNGGCLYYRRSDLRDGEPVITVSDAKWTNCLVVERG